MLSLQYIIVHNVLEFYKIVGQQLKIILKEAAR